MPPRPLRRRGAQTLLRPRALRRAARNHVRPVPPLGVRDRPESTKGRRRVGSIAAAVWAVGSGIATCHPEPAQRGEGSPARLAARDKTHSLLNPTPSHTNPPSLNVTIVASSGAKRTTYTPSFARSI